MVSKASDDLPLPLRPVTTTSLSRGICNVRFLRLCSRAPPILMNSLLMAVNFSICRKMETTPSPPESKAVVARTLKRISKPRFLRRKPKAGRTSLPQGARCAAHLIAHAHVAGDNDCVCGREHFKARRAKAAALFCFQKRVKETGGSFQGSAV